MATETQAKPVGDEVHRQIVMENTFILDPEGYGKVQIKFPTVSASVNLNFVHASLHC